MLDRSVKIVFKGLMDNYGALEAWSYLYNKTHDTRVMVLVELAENYGWDDSWTDADEKLYETISEHVYNKYRLEDIE